jgi:uncharacterized protein (TIGR00369 family)
MKRFSKAIALLQSEIDDDPPEGYVAMPSGSGFNQIVGPVYGRMQNGKLSLGMRIGHRHVNPHDTCHGGILASFADMQVYVSQQQSHLRYTLMPTVSMSIDFITPARLGNWLEGRTTLIQATKSTLFQQTLAVVGNQPIIRASCVYRITKHRAPEGSTLGDMFPDVS